MCDRPFEVCEAADGTFYIVNAADEDDSEDFFIRAQPPTDRDAAERKCADLNTGYRYGYLAGRASIQAEIRKVIGLED